MRPRLDQYKSASKSRLKKESRGASQADKAEKNSLEKAVHDLLERYEARAHSIPYEPAWRREKSREKMEELARLLSEEMPQEADAFIEGMESTNASSGYPWYRRSSTG